jgi:hypothetical protein
MPIMPMLQRLVRAGIGQARDQSKDPHIIAATEAAPTQNTLFSACCRKDKK